MMNEKNYYAQKSVSCVKCGKNTYKVCVGGGFYTGNDEYDKAATFLINNTVFKVTFMGGSAYYEIVELDGIEQPTNAEIVEQFSDTEQHLLYILSKGFLMRRLSGFSNDIKGFIEFVRWTWRPMSIFK